MPFLKNNPVTESKWGPGAKPGLGVLSFFDGVCVTTITIYQCTNAKDYNPARIILWMSIFVVLFITFFVRYVDALILEDVLGDVFC